MIHKIDIKTSSKVEFQDVTSQIRDVVGGSSIENGICHVYVPHTTAGVMINEHADPSVVDDIGTHLAEMVPQHRNYRHMEGNSPAHIKASIIGASQMIFIEGRKLVLGTWQGIFFCEFDGPRNRHLLIKIMADKS